MGVVYRQGGKNYIIHIFSIFLGIFNNLFIYPKYLALHGFVQTLYNLIKILVPYCLLGLSSVINRFHTMYRSPGKQGLWQFILKWFIISSILFSVVYVLAVLLMDVFLIESFPSLGRFRPYVVFIWIYILITSGITILNQICYVNMRVVVPNILDSFFRMKLATPLLILGIGYFGLNHLSLLYGILTISLLSLIALLVYCYYHGLLKFANKPTRLTKNELKSRINFGLFGLLNDTSVYLAFSIDIIMVDLLLGDKLAGIYAVFLFLANVIKSPSAAIGGLILPMVATLWENNDINTIEAYYKRTSITLFSVSLGIFLSILASFDAILGIMKYSPTGAEKLIFIFISIGVLVNMILYLNGSILVQSKFYRWNLFFILVLAVLNIGFTYFFIVKFFTDDYKNAGAALGTALSLVVFNFLKSSFIYWKFKIHPFSKKTLIALFIGLVVYLIMLFLPSFNNNWIQLIFRSSTTFVLFFLLIYFFSVSDDLRRFSDKIIGQLSVND